MSDSTTEKSHGRRAVVLIASSVLFMAMAFALAFLVLQGQIAAYEFERGAPPTGGDFLIARIEAVASIVAAVSAVGLFVAAAARESRTIVVLAVLGVFVGFAYLLLIMFVSAIAF